LSIDVLCHVGRRSVIGQQSWVGEPAIGLAIAFVAPVAIGTRADI